MKIHSDKITSQDINEATRAAGMRGVYEEHTTHGSRSRKRSFNVKLTGNSTRRPNPGTGPRDFGPSDYAATWDEWGMFINALFVIDPEAIIGQYRDLDTFQLHTGDRFESLTAPYACANHNWQFAAPYVQECKYCSATRRFDVLYAEPVTA